MGRDSAKNTALRIFDARPGAPLIIPGALEVRAGKPGGGKVAASLAHAPPTLGPAADDHDDRNRTEHQIEGGGAVSQRRSDGHHTLLARLFRLFRGLPVRP
jgi:hypothetical protein